GSISGRINLGKPWLQRLHTAGVYAGFVHSSTVIVAEDLLGAALDRGFVGSGFFQDVVELVFGGFSRGPALAPARHRGRDGVVRAPCAVGKFEEVMAGIGFAIEVGDIDAMERLGEAERGIE